MPIVSAIVGAIGAVATAIGGALAGAASFLTGGTLLAKVAMAGLSMAAQYALQKFLGPKPPAAQASKLETQYGEKLAREIVQGTVGTAGHHVYRNAYGKGNRTVQDVYVLSHFNISGVSRVRYKGEWKTLGGTPDAERGLRIQGIDAEIWVKVYTGRMDQTADAGLIARSNPAGRWTENHRGAGVAYAVVTSALHRETLPSPWEAFFEVVGVTYDWRKDDTVGGEGDHRFDDPTTWEPTTNPVLMAYCATRGFWRGDEKIAGKGRPASALPLSYWTLAANICDEMVEGKRRYQAAAILSSGEGTTHDANLKPLLEACAASWLEMVGQEYPIVGANQTPVTTFTDDDIVIDEPFRFSAKRTRSELVNTVAGTYVDPTSFYQAMPLATRIDDVALAADGERLAVPLSFSAVTEPACVDRLADIALRASRYQGSADLCLRPKFLALRPGQWVTWQSARYGWTKQFQVLSKRLGAFGPKGTRNVFVSLQEVGAGIFDPTAYVTVPPDGVLQGAPDFESELQDFLVVGVTVKDTTTGKQYPALRASWSAPNDPTVIGVDICYRPKTQPEAELPHPTVPDDVTVTTIANGVVSETLFEVSYRLVTSPFRVTPWSAWHEVLTPATPWNDIYPPGIDGIGDDIRGFQEWAGNGLREIERRLEEYDLWMADQDFGNEMDRQKLRQQITATYDQSKAEWTYEVNVVALANAALAVRTEALEATVNDPATGLAATANAVDALETSVSEIDGEMTAIANAVTSLSAATTPGEVNEANFRMEAVSGPTGYSRIGLRTRQGGAGAWRGAAAYLDTPNNPAEKTRFAVVADQMVVMDGAGNVSAVFDGDTAYFDNARIRNIDADNINVNALTSTAGFFDNVYISSSLQLGPNVVQTDVVQIGALTDSDDASENNYTPPIGTPHPDLVINIDSRAGLPILINLSVLLIRQPTGTGPDIGVRASILVNGVEVWAQDARTLATGTPTVNASAFRLIPTVAGQSYEIRYRKQIGAGPNWVWGGASHTVTSTADLVAFCNKA